jgi:hypothetical protein
MCMQPPLHAAAWTWTETMCGRVNASSPSHQSELVSRVTSDRTPHPEGGRMSRRPEGFEVLETRSTRRPALPLGRPETPEET